MLWGGFWTFCYWWLCWVLLLLILFKILYLPGDMPNISAAQYCELSVPWSAVDSSKVFKELCMMFLLLSESFWLPAIILWPLEEKGPFCQSLCVLFADRLVIVSLTNLWLNLSHVQGNDFPSPIEKYLLSEKAAVLMWFLLVPTGFWGMEFSLSSTLYLYSKATCLDLVTLSFQLVDVCQFRLHYLLCCPCTGRSEKMQEIQFLF